MGRPRDDFVWKHVEVTKEGWICKFCEGKFKGSASRIRNHLSKQGTDISGCQKVPQKIRKEALEKVQKEALEKGTRKRQRPPLQSSSSTSTPASLFQDPSPSSSSDTFQFTKKATDEYVTDAFIKFLMCSKFSSVGPEVVKDRYFREYMERAHKYGVASSLLQDDSLVIEKSLLNIKQEVSKYMLMVKESWKTTGCTVMMFNLNRENKRKSSVFEKDRYVCGFYCPKGFIFFEVPDPDRDRKGFPDALERDSLSLANYYADLVISHLESKSDEDLENDYSCEFSENGKKAPPRLPTLLQKRCTRQEIQRTCIKVCSSSEWAQGLINKAIKLQEVIQSDEDLAYLCDRLLTEKGKRLIHKGNLNAKGASGLSNFLSIMLLEDTLKEKLSYLMRSRLAGWHRRILKEITDDFDFWDDGRKLEQVLNLILKISDLMDTLVPTAGYLAMAIHGLDVFTCRYSGMEGVRVLCEELVSQLRTSSLNGVEWEVCGYMNPFHYLKQIRRDPEHQREEVAEVLKSEFFDEEDHEKLEGELNCYHNVCSNLPTEFNLHNYHPVRFWEKYGGELPTLQKLAIKVLSRPVTCMCNQVKKHLYELQGADDVVLRLNLRMMEEFKLLGDDIYKPIDLSELTDWWSS